MEVLHNEVWVDIVGIHNEVWVDIEARTNDLTFLNPFHVGGHALPLTQVLRKRHTGSIPRLTEVVAFKIRTKTDGSCCFQN